MAAQEAHSASSETVNLEVGQERTAPPVLEAGPVRGVPPSFREELEKRLAGRSGAVPGNAATAIAGVAPASVGIAGLALPVEDGGPAAVEAAVEPGAAPKEVSLPPPPPPRPPRAPRAPVPPLRLPSRQPEPAQVLTPSAASVALVAPTASERSAAAEVPLAPPPRPAPSLQGSAAGDDGNHRAGTASECSSPRSTLGNNFLDGPPDELLYRPPAGLSLCEQSWSRDPAGVPDLSVPTTWRRKHLEGELQLVRGALRESRLRSVRLEEELQASQRENARLRRQLDVRCDRDELLRDVRQREDLRARAGEEATEPAGRRRGVRGCATKGSDGGGAGGRLCGAVIALLGRR